MDARLTTPSIAAFTLARGLEVEALEPSRSARSTATARVLTA
jgi:hypothetical protein